MFEDLLDFYNRSIKQRYGCKESGKYKREKDNFQKFMIL